MSVHVSTAELPIEDDGSLRCLLSFMSPAEAIHLGSLIAAHGYVFPISDHVLTLKDDGTLYRFQVRKKKSTLRLSLICVRRPLNIE